MSHRTRVNLSIFARLFMACAALLLLTSTVMEREDRDGYQATHLFFMPRQTWEMDDGKGMLHAPEYYTDVDIEAFLEEELVASYHYVANPTLDISTAQAAGSFLAALVDDHGSGSYKPVLSKMSHIPNLSGNEIPVGQSGVGYPWAMAQSAILLLTIVPLTMWLGDTPTPPPRSIAPLFT